MEKMKKLARCGDSKSRMANIISYKISVPLEQLDTSAMPLSLASFSILKPGWI